MFNCFIEVYYDSDYGDTEHPGAASTACKFFTGPDLDRIYSFAYWFCHIIYMDIINNEDIDGKLQSNDWAVFK